MNQEIFNMKVYQHLYYETNKERILLIYKNNKARISIQRKEQQSKHKPEQALRNKIWRESHIDELREKKKIYAKTHRDKNNKSNRKSLLKTKYRLSEEDYEQMVIVQNNKCKICGRDMKRPYVDHNHKQGKVRGLLCMNCNTALGHFRDSIEILQNAILYLKNSQQTLEIP